MNGAEFGRPGLYAERFVGVDFVQPQVSSRPAAAVRNSNFENDGGASSLQRVFLRYRCESKLRVFTCLEGFKMACDSSFQLASQSSLGCGQRPLYRMLLLRSRIHRKFRIPYCGYEWGSMSWLSA